MAIIPQLLDILVVAVLVGDVEGAVDGTAIGIGATLAEQLAIQVPVLVVDSIIKCKGHHLRHLGYGMGEDLTTDSSKLHNKMDTLDYFTCYFVEFCGGISNFLFADNKQRHALHENEMQN